MAKPVVGVALGAGGARGFAHIGVLQALEEAGIDVDVVAGSSMGSLVGALYATGVKPAFMARLAAQIRRRHWLDVGMQRLGLLSGDKVRHLVRLLTRDRNIDEAEKSLAIVATDLIARKNVMFVHEPIADAVRASISIPGLFTPYQWNGGVYVDGGVLNPVPIDAAEALGAEIVIAVDVSFNPTPWTPHSAVDVILQAFEVMQDYVPVAPIGVPVVRVEPDLADVGISHFHRADEAINAGYRATLSALPAVKALI